MSADNLFKMDVFGPADAWDVLPEGSTVGTGSNFVMFSVGFSPEHHLTADEADVLSALLTEAAKKLREQRLTSKHG